MSMNSTQRRILSLYLPGWAGGRKDGDPDPRPLVRLATWCGRYTPRGAADLPDGIILDITGHGAGFPEGEAGLAADIERRLAAAGIPCRIAVADNAAAAWGLARYAAAPPVLTGGEEMASLCRELPLAAARLSSRVAAGLARQGVRRIGELSLIPPPLLVRRLGPEACGRVDMMLGRSLALPAASPLSPDRRVCMRFEPPALAGGANLPGALSGLVAEMAQALAAEGVGARHFVLTGYRADHEVVSASASPREPRQDAGYLSRVFKPKLKLFGPGPGFEVLALDAMATAPFILDGAVRRPSLHSVGPLYTLPESEGGTTPLSESVPKETYRAPIFRSA